MTESHTKAVKRKAVILGKAAGDNMGRLYVNDALDAVESINSSKSDTEVLENLLAYTKPLGFDRYLISHIVNPLQPTGKKIMLHTNYPEELINARFDEQEFTHDPVVKYAMRSRHPFTWQEAYEFASRYGMKIAAPSRDFEMHDGFMVPMRKPGWPDGGLSLATEKYDLSEDRAAHLQMVCVYAYKQLNEIYDPEIETPRCRLSQQETDALQYAAAGKTAWEISMILSISESAAVDALKRARTKLGATNIAQAIAIAIGNDFIIP